MSRPLQISAETAIKLSEQLKVPVEHLMHMPRHILLQKMAELANTPAPSPAQSESPSQSGQSTEEPKAE